MDTKQISTGALPSPLDYRDEYAASGIAATLSGVTLLPALHNNVGPTLMQALEPACTSFMAVEILKLWWFTKTGEWVDFSPRFLDTLAKRFDGQDRATGGTFGRLVMHLLAVYGCATTATLPNDTSLPVLLYRQDSLLTPAVFAEAAKFKIPGYFQVPKDKQSTRAAIQLYGAVGMLAYIDAKWWTPSWAASEITPLKTPNQNLSLDEGHATTRVGWADTTLDTLRNHWSEAWANQGEANFDGDAWSPFIMEQWAIAEIPSDTRQLLAMLPSPANIHFQWNTNLVQGMEVVGSVDFAGTLNGIGRYATDPIYSESIAVLYNTIESKTMMSAAKVGAIQDYISSIVPVCPVKAEMIVLASQTYGIDPALLTAVLQHESRFGTLGAGAHTLNPGNVGNVDNGGTHTFPSWQDGVNACAYQLQRRQMPGGTDDVRFLQIAYMSLGLLAPIAFSEFGIFGAKTAEANRKYQVLNDITPSPANVGPMTRAALNKQFPV